MRKILLLVVVVIAIFGSYIGYRSLTVQQFTELQIANIESLANEESPVKIPCAEKKNSDCKFLTEGTDGIWRHVVIKDMEKSN